MTYYCMELEQWGRYGNCITNWTTEESVFHSRQLQGFFVIPTAPMQPLRPTHRPIQCLPNLLFPGLRRPIRQGDQEPVKLYFHSPICLRDPYRDNFNTLRTGDADLRFLHGETRYICKFSLVPLHKGEGFQMYHTLKHY